MIPIVSVGAGDINIKICWFNIDTEDREILIDRCIHTQFSTHMYVLVLPAEMG